MASKQQLDQHKENLSRILACLREEGAITRKELARRTSLSWGCVSESLTDLIGRGLVVESKEQEHQGMGRVPLRLTLSDRFFFLGVDVNEIGLRACIINLSGKPCAFFDRPMEGTDESTLCRSVLSFAEEILGKHPNILGIGFAMQGIYDQVQDSWLFPTPDGRVPLRLRAFLQKHLSLPIYLEHDPCCALLSEVRDNRPSRRLLVRLDRGVGAAMGQGQRLFRDGLLELGETVVDAEGTRLHQLCTLKAMEENPLLPKEEFFREAGLALGRVLGNLCHVFFLDEILLCGGMLTYADLLLPPIREAMRLVCTNPPTLRSAEHADPALGAARLAAEAHIY